MVAENYKVIKKEELRMLEDGDVVVRYRIYAKSSGGTAFSIDVAEADLDKAPKLLTEKARKLDSIV